MIRCRHATLEDCGGPAEVVVVVDVLRAFTTAAYAFAAGARRIVCVATVAQALAARARVPGALAMGEVGGLPVDGFDLSNSPAEIHGADLRGRVLVQRTSAGTQGLVRSASGARHLFAASFVCAAATARAIRALRPAELTLVSTGVDHRDGDEDRACADYLEALVRGGRPDPGPYLERVRAADAARPFLSPDRPEFPERDVTLALRADAVDVALEGRLEGDGVVLRPRPAPGPAG